MTADPRDSKNRLYREIPTSEGEVHVAGYADLHALTEDQRIDLIGRTVLESGKTVGVCVDDQPAKVARYIRKFRERFPTVVVLSQSKGPVAGVVTIKLGPQ